MTEGIGKYTFRLNPAFRITPVKTLTGKQKEKFRQVLAGTRPYSLLHCPGRANFTVKAINRPMTEFLLSLREPEKLNRLPRKFRPESGNIKPDLINKLILDDVLEVLREGEFVSGAEGYNLLNPPPPGMVIPPDRGNPGHIGRISRMALQFALQSNHRSRSSLSSLLYLYNTLPMHRNRREKLPDREAVSEFLGLDREGRWRGMPSAIHPVDKPDDSNVGENLWGWWEIDGKRINTDRNYFKVYISPLPEETPEVFGMVRGKVAASGAHSFRVGITPVSILRPARMEVYFASPEEAGDFAGKMTGVTSEFRGQGVPFTYQFKRNNRLISLGVDPPRENGSGTTWRRYITGKLAGIIARYHCSGREDPLEFIREGMRRWGIDADRWRPVREGWAMDFVPENRKGHD